jgi:hypothetical protein
MYANITENITELQLLVQEAQNSSLRSSETWTVGHSHLGHLENAKNK